MVMARTFLVGGQTASFGFGTVTYEIIGTNENETINVGARADTFFDGSFNRGGDVINIVGNAESYTATIVGGSRLVLTAADGTKIDIPVGGVGVTINFDNAAGRLLKFDDAGAMLLGDQTINTTGPTVLDPGDDTPPPPTSDPIYLTSYADRNGDYNGTSGNDRFVALREGAASGSGNVVNTLQSGDIIRGGIGQDSLFAVLGSEAGNPVGIIYDVQPTINSVERIEIEAREQSLIAGGNNYGGAVYFDAKNVSGHVRIGSKESDGDLVIENLNTLNANGVARNTEEITITMDHTDNLNSDGDASDLFVFFDDDYLLAGQSRTTSQANYWLLDEDSPDYVNQPLANIERNGVRLSIDGTPVSIEITTDIASIPDSWEGYAAALQTRINQMIAAGTTILQGITVTVDWNNTEQTYNDFGNLVTIPAITLIDANGRELVPTGYLIPEGASGSFDIFGRFDNDPSEALDNPVAVNIELHKVGRAGDGGDLIVGGKAGDKGIEVFHVSVLGAADKPNSIGTMASTGGALAEVYITTDPSAVNGTTHASLEIRDGFGDAGTSNPGPDYPGSSLAPNDMRLVDADAFLGDLLLGTETRVVNLDTLEARGGGDVTFRGTLNGAEANQPYTYLTGAGDDSIDVSIDGDAVDFAQSSLDIDSGAGDDNVTVSFNLVNSGEIINQAILRNVSISTGDGNDVVSLGNMTSVQPGYGNAEIRTGSGNDQIYTSGGVKGTTWAFNYDDALVVSTAGSLGAWATGPRGLDDLPGVQTSLQYLGGATVRVALSAAGTGTIADGGGVGAYAGADAIPAAYENGYEASGTIGNTLIGGRKYFGDQRDINAKIIDIINNDPVLSKLLVAVMGPNNTLLISTLTGGEFRQEDLEITIQHRNWQNTQTASEILAEARAVTGNSALLDADLWGGGSYSSSTTYNPTGAAAAGGLADLSLAANANTYYTGLGVDQADLALDTGAQSLFETDNLINAGTGDDLIVLSTDAVGWTTGIGFTVSSNNAHWNGASNETVQMDGIFATRVGDTVVNFSTAFGTAQPTGLGSAAAAQATFLDGMDFLDFSSYLTSQEDESITGPGNPDSNDSHHQIAVTLEADTIGVNANEVAVIKFTGNPTQAWDGLNNAVIESLFNTHTGLVNFGNFNDAAFTANDEYPEPTNGTDPLVNTAKAILMVENTANLGEYRVFELSWNGNASADPNDTALNGVVTAREIGDLDFGTTLVGLHAVNLVGSADYNSLVTLGFFDTNYVASNTTVLA